MSLLMQALKKAERAKQNILHDEELAKPSEAFDALLALAPLEPPRAAPDNAPAPAPAALSLSPLDDTSAARAPLEFAPGPSAHNQSAGAPPRPAASTPDSPAPRHPPAPAPGPARTARRPATLRRSALADPRVIRAAVLGGLLMLVVGAFSYIYWRAMYGPGSSRNLPMVPMVSAAPDALPVLVVSPDPAASAPAPASPADSGAISNYATPLSNVQLRAAPVAAAAPVPTAQSAPLQRAPAPQMPQIPEPAPESLPPIAAPDYGPVRVVRNTAREQVNPVLQGAFASFNAGDNGAARAQYDSVLKQDANNRDALLGMAALALREHKDAQAAGIYLRLLELDPFDADATAGMVGARQGDPAQTESRLRRILQRTPENGPVLFALANLYGQQGRWSDAQQLYFRAYTLAPANADYAFNLAVSLDRINQGKLALGYYQRAATLAQTGAASFERAALARRVAELGGQ